MDNGISTAIEIGQRLRRYRNLMGLSQKNLADLIATTPQNISKYEKEGLRDIEAIQRLSAALGHDLLTDERDEEGEIGEVGQEILLILLENFGYCYASKLLDGKTLYGMSDSNVIRELSKLQKLGMIVREQYKDFSGCNYDQVFITAKGIIGLKHLNISKKMKKRLKKAKTYEMICGECGCYQDYVDAQPEQRSIRKLMYVSGYRKPLIDHIHDHYEIGLDAHYHYELTVPSYKNVYQQIMMSMIEGERRETEDDYIKHVLEHTFFASPEIEAEYLQLREELHVSDEVEYGFFDYLEDISYLEKDNMLENWNPGGRFLSDQPDKDAYEDRILRCSELHNKRNAAISEAVEYDFDEILSQLIEEKGSSCPVDWFAIDEIEAYIRANILPAKTEAEEYVEEKIQYIFDKQSEIAQNYFVFPHEWERNGLAELVRKLYGVTRFFK